jgi:hypothetical protein
MGRRVRSETGGRAIIILGLISEVVLCFLRRDGWVWIRGARSGRYQLRNFTG